MLATFVRDIDHVPCHVYWKRTLVLYGITLVIWSLSHELLAYLAVYDAPIKRIVRLFMSLIKY